MCFMYPVKKNHTLKPYRDLQTTDSIVDIRDVYVYSIENGVSCTGLFYSFFTGYLYFRLQSVINKLF